MDSHKSSAPANMLSGHSERSGGSHHNNRRRSSHEASSRRRDSHNIGANAAAGVFHHHQRATVKSILWTGITVSFGSIAHCGLLGILAQFVYSQVRRIEAAQVAITRARSRRNRGDDGGFRGMEIGSSSSNAASGMMDNIWTKAIILARRVVRNHSDLAMTHVAAYYKGYVRAARDVATIIEESGMLLLVIDELSSLFLPLVQRYSWRFVYRIQEVLTLFFSFLIIVLCRCGTHLARRHYNSHVHLHGWIDFGYYCPNHNISAAPSTQELRASERHSHCREHAPRLHLLLHSDLYRYGTATCRHQSGLCFVFAESPLFQPGISSHISSAHATVRI